MCFGVRFLGDGNRAFQFNLFGPICLQFYYILAGSSSGNSIVPLLISTYCSLRNSSLTSLSLFGSHGALNRMLPTTSQSSLPAFSFGSVHPSIIFPRVPTLLNKPFVVGPGYSPIPEKLVTKIRSGQFVEMANLLAKNLKAQEVEPQTYLDGTLLVSSSKKRIQEITDIIIWVEAFTVYMWIFCLAHPSRWQDMTQQILLIMKTSHQSGKAWLHYDLAFQKDASASGLADWSCMNLDLYNFHTHHPSPLPLHPHHQSLATCHLTSASRGTMAPVTGPLVNVGTATAAKNAKGTTHVLTAPSGPLVLRPLPSSNASCIEAFAKLPKTSFLSNFVNSVQFSHSVSASSHSSCSVPVNVVVSSAPDTLGHAQLSENLAHPSPQITQIN